MVKRLIFFVTCLGIVWGCYHNKASSIQLEFWAMGAEGEYLDQLVPEFEAQNPEIKVKVQTIPWNAAHEKLLTAYAGQSTPDMCQLGNTWLPEFEAIGALQNLDSLIACSSIVAPEKFFPGIWETNIIHNCVYGISWYVDTRVLFYRKDILAQVGYASPPKTWKEWFDVCQKIKKTSRDDNQRYGVFFSTKLNDWQVPVILILQNGGRLLTRDNCYAAFDNPRTVEALQYYVKFFREGLAVENMTEVANIYQAFSEGVFSMMVTGPWNVNEMRRRVPRIEGRWTTAPMPCKLNCNSVAGGASLVIFKRSPHKKAAWKFIEFLSKPETQIRFFQLTKDLPAVKAAWLSPELQSDPEIRSFYLQLEHVVPTPKIAEWEQIASKIQEHLEQVIFGSEPMEKAIQKLNKDVDRILEKRRWLLSKNVFPANQ